MVDPQTLVLAISQSGETADTLAAMRVARERGAKVVAITNIMGSAVTREADGVLYTRAGLEIGVAATKTFTAQVVLLTLLALRLAELRHRLPAERIAELGRRAAAAAGPGAGRAGRPGARRVAGRSSPSASATTASSSSWAGTSACRCASRAR